MEHRNNDSTRIEILVVGWIRELFASKQFAALEISPHLTQIFVVWYSPEIEWRFKTEFSETQCIGYLADSGEVIKGQVVMTTQNEDGVTAKVHKPLFILPLEEKLIVAEPSTFHDLKI